MCEFPVRLEFRWVQKDLRSRGQPLRNRTVRSALGLRVSNYWWELNESFATSFYPNFAFSLRRRLHSGNACIYPCHQAHQTTVRARISTERWDSQQRVHHRRSLARWFWLEKVVELETSPAGVVAAHSALDSRRWFHFSILQSERNESPLPQPDASSSLSALKLCRKLSPVNSFS